MAMCISKSTLNCCLGKLFALVWLSENLRLKWTRRSERSSRSCMDISGEERVVLMDPHELVRVGSYKRSFTCDSTLLVALTEA